MKGDAELDALLQQRFESQKRHDAQHAPAFEAMLLRARQDAADSVPVVEHIVALPAPSQPRAARRRIVRWAGPLAIAAGLGAIYLLSARTAERAADREFDRLVTEWTQTAAATSHAPTDGLLSSPGSELLGSMPRLGPVLGGVRGRS